MIYMALNCVRPTQSSVKQTIHRNVGLKCFFLHFLKCLFVIIAIHSYFVYISQGSVETRLWCGGIYNNHNIANFRRVCQLKNFENRFIIGKGIEKSKMAHFYWPTLQSCSCKIICLTAFRYISSGIFQNPTLGTKSKETLKNIDTLVNAPKLLSYVFTFQYFSSKNFPRFDQYCTDHHKWKLVVILRAKSSHVISCLSC